MTEKATDESAPASQEPPKKDGELTERQLAEVAGAGGRSAQDCEGAVFLTQKLLGTRAASSALTSE
jgi:hypothetical protein